LRLSAAMFKIVQTKRSRLWETFFMTVIDFSRSERGARVLRIAGCRMRARQRTAQAEREPQYRSYHLEAAKAWLRLASKLEQTSSEMMFLGTADEG
jgi:hypothetical protein